MLDIKKLKVIQYAIKRVRYEVCKHAITDLHAISDLKENCYNDGCDCPYRRLCELLTCAYGRSLFMEDNPDRPNFSKYDR